MEPGTKHVLLNLRDIIDQYEPQIQPIHADGLQDTLCALQKQNRAYTALFSDLEAKIDEYNCSGSFETQLRLSHIHLNSSNGNVDKEEVLDYAPPLRDYGSVYPNNPALPMERSDKESLSDLDDDEEVTRAVRAAPEEPIVISDSESEEMHVPENFWDPSLDWPLVHAIGAFTKYKKKSNNPWEHALLHMRTTFPKTKKFDINQHHVKTRWMQIENSLLPQWLTEVQTSQKYKYAKKAQKAWDEYKRKK
tara:strand:- start:5235 stop:5981 length:747 start_codon:yes stop_codon:yes gene_type:complete